MDETTGRIVLIAFFVSGVAAFAIYIFGPNKDCDCQKTLDFPQIVRVVGEVESPAAGSGDLDSGKIHYLVEGGSGLTILEVGKGENLTSGQYLVINGDRLSHQLLQVTTE